VAKRGRKHSSPKKEPSAKQRANWARFAAMARARRGTGARASPRPSIRSSHRGSVSGVLGAKPKWLQMLLFGLFGYFLAPTLTNLGLGKWLSESFPAYAQVTGDLWTGAGGSSNPNNPWDNYGLSGIAKAGGLALFGETMYRTAKNHGQLSQVGLNAKLPFAAGLMLDPPEARAAAGPSGWSMVGGPRMDLPTGSAVPAYSGSGWW